VVVVMFFVRMRVAVVVMVFVLMAVTVVMRVVAFVVMIVVVREVDIELDAGDAGLLRFGDVQVVAVELELFQFARELVGIHAKVNECGDKHVAGDAAEGVEVKGFHLPMLFAPD